MRPGSMGMSATPLFDPRGYMELEARFSGRKKEFTIVGNEVEDYPEGFVQHFRSPIASETVSSSPRKAR